MYKAERIYGVYRGDEFLTVGTAKECADFLGVKEKTIRFMTTPSYAKRRKDDGNSLVVFVVEDC